MKSKSVFYLCLIFLGVLIVSCAYTEPIAPPGSLPEPTPQIEATLTLVVTAFEPGAVIDVYFTAPAHLSEYAWIGIIPSSTSHGEEPTNRENTLDYRYLEYRTSGVLSFTAPTAPGSYDLRMNEVAGEGLELISVSFSVEENADQRIESATLKLDRSVYKPGEEMLVFFTAPPSISQTGWIGIVDGRVFHGSEEENRDRALAFKRLEGRTSGIFTFTAPDRIMEYNVRLSDPESGRELAHAIFQVMED